MPAQVADHERQGVGDRPFVEKVCEVLGTLAQPGPPSVGPMVREQARYGGGQVGVEAVGAGEQQPPG
jgi:hypothetical protein